MLQSMTSSKNSTLDCYNENSDSYVAETVGVDFQQIQDKFLNRFDLGAYILDYGCGSGRDTQYFLE